MDRLNTLDAAFLSMENEAVQSNIGGVSVFEGPAPSYDEVCARIESNLRRAPRCRQRVHNLPGGLGHPVWVDDTRFAISNHVSLHDVPVRSLPQLQELFSQLIASHLDRDHPLWRLWVVDGLEGDRWAILWKVHHAMVDGIAATGVMSLLLDTEAEPSDGPGEPWEPRAQPSVARSVRESVTGAIRPSATLPRLERAARDPFGAISTVASSFRTVLPASRLRPTRSRNPLNGEIGPARVWRATQADLAEVKQIGRSFGGTVNDVVLAAVTNGIEHFLRERGDDPARFETRAMVPVSVRSQDEQGDVTNRVSAVFVDLPFGVVDPIERLVKLSDQMNQRKETDGAHAGEVIVGLGEMTPPALFTLGERALWRVAGSSRLMNTVITNVPGPQFPLYCLGRRMERFYPFVMLAKDIRVATAIFSYDGGIYFGVTGDRDSAFDVANVCVGIDDGIAMLTAAAA